MLNMVENDKFTAYGHFIEINGMNMYYIDNGQGHPLVLLHGGISTSGTTWANYIPILSQYFRLIIPDCRGRGKTNNPLHKLSYRILAEDTIALCKALNIEKPILCGWSDGGQICLEIGASFPEFAKGIIAGGAIFYPKESYMDILSEIGVKSPDIVDVAQLDYTSLETSMIALHSSVNNPEDWDMLLRQLMYLWSDPAEFVDNKYDQIKIPTLIGVGDRDPYIRIDKNVSDYTMFKNYEFFVLPNTAHGIIPMRIAKMLSNVIIDFVERILE